MGQREHNERSALRVGCVSYLNAKPLVEGLDAHLAHAIDYRVPSGLIGGLESGALDVALCPVIDVFRSAVGLRVLPVGGIGCDGATLTVRLFSPVPLEELETVHADTDSHTSVALLRVLLHARLGREVGVTAWDPRGGGGLPGGAVLLIGDKVVTAEPSRAVYPYQLDLGKAWQELTGLPFVFALWLVRPGVALGGLPGVMAAALERNLGALPALAERHASAHGWPVELALHYMRDLLRYRVGARELAAVERFGSLAAARGVGVGGRLLIADC